jgi:3-deoxy-D-manno-octulosonic acid (KDO) 8-phosphate synthase
MTNTGYQKCYLLLSVKSTLESRNISIKQDMYEPSKKNESSEIYYKTSYNKHNYDSTLNHFRILLQA